VRSCENQKKEKMYTRFNNATPTASGLVLLVHLPLARPH
jgi:hypothetical protein